MKEIAQLDQSTVFKGKHRFVLQDDGILRISQTEAGRHDEFSVEIGYLNPEPERSKNRATEMIVGMVAFGLLDGFFVCCAIASLGHRISDDVYVFAVFAAFLFLPFLLCLYSYLKRSYDVLVFQSPVTGARIPFLRNVPSVEAFAKFIDSLCVEIKTHRDRLPSVPKTLSQEFETLMKLRDRGALSEAEFQTAKRKLLSPDETAEPIGFRSK